MENKPALTAERRLAYIGDMADLETKEFLLKKAVKQMEEQNTQARQHASQKVNEADHYVNEASKNVKTISIQLNDLEKNSHVKPTEPENPKYKKAWLKKKKPNCPKKPKYFDYLSWFWWEGVYEIAGDIGGIPAFLFYTFLFFALPYGIFILLLGLASLSITGAFGNYIVAMFNAPEQLATLLHLSGGWGEFLTFLMTLVTIVFMPTTIIYFTRRIVYFRFQKPTWENYLVYEEYQKKYQDYLKAANNKQNLNEQKAKNQRALEDAQAAHQKALAEAKQTDLEIDLTNQQILVLKKVIHSIHTQKQELYALNIIPPDYREMDCVIMLHQIFRNGLKDNMADAILLYEERVYRQEIIRGIEKIYDMLGQLNATMRAIEDRLMDVQHELQMIGSDMSNQLASIRDNQAHMLSEMKDANEAQAAYAAAQEQWQREQLAETRASRYAAEAVQRSNEKYEWYMDQYRRGFL